MAISKSIQKTFTYTPSDGDIAAACGVDEQKTQTATFANAYIMVYEVKYDKSLGKVRFAAQIFTDSTKAVCIDAKFGVFVPNLTDGSANFVAQAYVYLKTLPEFSGAVDC